MYFEKLSQSILINTPIDGWIWTCVLCYGDAGQMKVAYRTSIGKPTGTYPENLAAETDNGAVQKIVFDPLNRPLGQTKYAAFASRALYLWCNPPVLYAFSLGMIHRSQVVI